MRVLAFDRASFRSIDADGRLHVQTNNISKASVDPYYGDEIPDFRALGLEPKKIYRMLRCPEELAKAAGTFNNLPILAEHVPVTVDDHQPDIVIGSTGTDAAFEFPFLRNSAVIWARGATDDIEAKRKHQWSCAYRYRPDMTPGLFNDLRYDGVMRDIIGNHVALVEEGRAGPEVVVADKMPKGIQMLKSHRALMLQGAIMAGVASRLKPGVAVNFSGAMDGVTVKNAEKNKSKIAAAVCKLAKPHLAADADLEIGDIVEIIDAVQGLGDGGDAYDGDDDDDVLDPTPAVDDQSDVASRMLAFCKGKMSDEDFETLAGMGTARAMDTDAASMADTDEKKAPPAMDAAAIRRQTIREMNDMREAERAVEPHVGPLAVAMDSAASIYRLALDNAGVDLTGVPVAAFKAMVGMLRAPSDAPPRIVAMDATASESFKARFPNAATLIRS